MAAKGKKEPTLTVIVRAGTPNDLSDTKTYHLPNQVKNWLAGRVTDRKQWADRYNVTCAEQLGSILVEISNLHIQALHKGEVRSWTATDDYTGVKFMFQLEIEAR